MNIFVDQPVFNLKESDPSRMGPLRQHLSSELAKRFRDFKTMVRWQIQNNDTFRFSVKPSLMDSNTKKVEQFKRWMKEALETRILSHSGLGYWFESQLLQAHKRGVLRVFSDVQKEGLHPGTLEPTEDGWLRYKPNESFQGSVNLFLSSVMRRKDVLDRLEMFKTQIVHNLEEICSSLCLKSSRAAVDGLARHRNNRQIAQTILMEIHLCFCKRGLPLCLTEPVRFHSEGELDAFEALGMDKVQVQCESKCIPKCSCEGDKVFTVQKARGVIPFHPGCSCHWTTTSQGEPMAESKGLDSQGGEKPAISLKLLEKADFVTLPPKIMGTNCENCKFEKDGLCTHPKLKGQPVNDRNCCALWDAPKTLREWRKQ